MSNWSLQLSNLITGPVAGTTSATAYDTAWVADVPDPKNPYLPAFPSALDWLVSHQHADGSWGGQIEYHHDRTLSTLRSVLTLTHWQRRQGHDRWAEQIAKAVGAFWRHSSWLSRDPYELIGFELLLPTLLDEAREVGLSLPFELFDGLKKIREAKLRRIPPELASGTTLIFSAEFLGNDLDPERLCRSLDEQGSLGASPSATAAYLIKAPGDHRAHDYLSRVVARGLGAGTAVDPIDTFELAWNLFNASLVFPEGVQLGQIQGAVDILRNELTRKRGTCWSTYFTVPDLDDTAMAVRVLSWLRIPWSLELLQQFEEAEHFRCFPFERNPSVSAHVHLVDALNAAPRSAERDRMLDKALRFLERSRVGGLFWFDKWHASPYYTTAHAIIAMRDQQDLASRAIRWLIETQRSDGSWGYYGLSSAEETAYCVQALADLRLRGGDVPNTVLERGAAYLEASEERRSEKYVSLWLAKSLYTPIRVVHSTVLSALALAQLAQRR